MIVDGRKKLVTGAPSPAGEAKWTLVRISDAAGSRASRP